MAEKTFKIVGEGGIHARPATLLVTESAKYDSEITLTYNGKTVNLKSIMGVMSLGVSTGKEVVISANGNDAEAALAGMEQVLKSNGIA